MISTEINKIKQLEKIIRITLEKLRDGRIREEQFSKFLEKFGWKYDHTKRGISYSYSNAISDKSWVLVFGTSFWKSKWDLVCNVEFDNDFVGGGSFENLNNAIIAILLPLALKIMSITVVRKESGNNYGVSLVCEDEQGREFLIWYSAWNFYVGFSRKTEYISIDSCADIAKFLMIDIDRYKKVEKQYLKELRSKLKKFPIVVATSKKNVFLSRNDKFVSILEAKTSHALKVLKSLVGQWDYDKLHALDYGKDYEAVLFSDAKVTSLFTKLVVFYWLIENSEKFEITKSDLDSEEYEVVFTYKGQSYFLEKSWGGVYLDGTSRVPINSLSPLLLLLEEGKNG